MSERSITVSPMRVNKTNMKSNGKDRNNFIFFCGRYGEGGRFRKVLRWMTVYLPFLLWSVAGFGVPLILLIIFEFITGARRLFASEDQCHVNFTRLTSVAEYSEQRHCSVVTVNYKPIKGKKKS